MSHRVYDADRSGRLALGNLIDLLKVCVAAAGG